MPANSHHPTLTSVPSPMPALVLPAQRVPAQVLGELDELATRLTAGRRFDIGFPGATDLDFTPLEGWWGRLLNNVGDPFVDGAGTAHTKELEREVVDWLADLFHAPVEDRWGYVTSGGSEGNLFALRLASALYPDAIVYFSDAAHYSVDKAIHLLGLPSVRVRTSRWGEVDYDDLTTLVNRHRDRPVIIVATAGTTMTEATDDTRRITGLLDDLAVRRRFVHVDAALAGVPLALLDPLDRPGFDFDDGADSITVSGHKFLGCPTPCGVVVVRASDRNRVARTVGYIATPDATIGGSRSGHAPLMLWWVLRTVGIGGMMLRAQHSRDLAASLHGRLLELGWVTHRHPHAFTVVLKTPPQAVLDRWVLANHDGWSHVITMPGVTADAIDEFVANLYATIATTPDPTPVDGGSRLASVGVQAATAAPMRAGVVA